MEHLLGSWSLGEESLQMWDLNKRLEAYLARVKYLEEENEVLKAEIQSLKVSPVENSWWGKYEEEVAALRATLDQAFREKCTAELARDALREEVQQVTSKCQKERAAQEEAKKLLSMGKKDLEEEKRAHLWLKEKATQLEKEMEALLEAHQEEMARLDQEMAGFSTSLESFRAVPVCFQPVEVEDYAKRLSNIWKGAVETYKTEVSQLEVSLCEAKENLWKATESSRQNHLQMQQLEKELAGLKIRKEILEESLSQQWRHQHAEAEKLQLAIESLEEEKQSLQVQIAQVLEDRQQLMHLKMSLSLEVATYRTLLEAESTRLQMPISDLKIGSGTRDAKLEARNSKIQAVSLAKGHLGSRDLRPHSTAFLKASTVAQLPKNQNDSFAVNVGSGVLKSRSPVAREFQKANTVLQSQSPKCLEVALPRKDFPAFTGSISFRLGSSQQTKMARATQIDVVSQSFLQESPPHFSSICPVVPDTSEMSSSNTEQQCQEEGESRDVSVTQTKTENTGKKNELYDIEMEEEEEVEERQTNEEPPGKATIQNVPCPSQLVTEALDFALNGADTHLESSLFNVDETQNGIPSDDSSSTEENVAASNTGLLEEGTQKVPKEQMEDIQPAGQEAIKCPEELTEVNDGHKTCVIELQEQDTWAQLSQENESTSPREKELLEEESKLDETVTVISVSAQAESSKGESSLPLNEDSDEQAHPLQNTGSGDGLEDATKCIEVVTHPDEDAPAVLRSEMESWASEISHHGDHEGATGAYLEEEDGGVEDLEVVSTEALHLSEDEERRELWSPPRENEEYDLQAETLESEFQQTEGFAIENLSPISPVPLSEESCHDDTFLGVQQKKIAEQEIPLSKLDFLPAEEGKESGLEQEAFSMEGTISRDDSVASDKANILIDDPRIMESVTAEEEFGEMPGEDILRHTSLDKEENGLRNEDNIEKKVFPATETESSHKITCEPDVPLQDENVIEEDTSAQKVAEDIFQAQMLAGKTVDNNEEIPVAFLEADGDIQKGDLVTNIEAVVIHSENTVDNLKVEEVRSDVDTHGLHDQETPAGCRNDDYQGEEHQIITGTEEAFQLQDTTHPVERKTQDIIKELEAPSKVQSGTIQAFQGNNLDDLSCHQTKCDDLGSEELLETLDIVLNTTCETDGISGTQMILEETLPDHTPLHMYEEKMLAMSEKSQPLLPASQKAAETTTLLIKDSFVLLEETQQESSHSPLTEENDNEQEGVLEEKGSSEESAAHQHSGASLSLKVLEETDASGGSEIGVELHTPEPEGPRVEDGFAGSHEESGKSSQQDDEAREDLELMEQHHDEDIERDFVWEPEKDHVFQADESDPSPAKEGTSMENDCSQAFSSQGNTEAEGPHKVSPLTSVSDLGEIVLEGEQSPGDQRGVAECEVLMSCGEEGPLLVPEYQQISDMENYGTEDHSQQEVLANDNPNDMDFPLPSSETALSVSDTNVKGTDILEIVEQALEFNQEVIKAAAKCTEAELPARAEEKHSSTDGTDHDAPIKSTNANASQFSPETLETSFVGAKDPERSKHLMTENNANGLQQDFTEEILNGIGPLQSGNAEQDINTPTGEEIRKITFTKQLQREELDNFTTEDNINQSLSRTLSNEAITTEEVSSEVYNKVLVDHKRLEALDANESIFTELMQTACMEGGKDAAPDAVSLPSDFEEKAVHVELSQHLKFQPEDTESLQSSEDN